jgi:RNA polymerase sigma-70 factor (sigma-E family)
MSDKTPPGFRDFVGARAPSLLRAAWLLTGDGHKAEDLLQTVLTQLWLRWSSVRDNPEAYARRMLYTTYVSWWRRRWRAETPTKILPDHADRDRIADSDQRAVVSAALAQLSRRQRAVVILRYLDDRSVEETATVLGCSPGAVKTHASRALAVLRANPHLHSLTSEEVLP